MELDVFHLFLWEPIWFADTPFEINRVVFLMYAAGLICIGFFAIGIRRRELVPRGMQAAVEAGYLFVKNNIAIDVIGPEGVKYANYLATIFFFIFFSNLFEIIPGINFPVTSRMAIPALLAVMSWFIFIFLGVKQHGFRYFREALFPPGVPWPVYILLTPIEAFSTFLLRPFTLAIRLFANMLAGHVLLTVFFLFTEDLITSGNPFGMGLSVLTFATAIILILFELLVITIQAYIFTTLTAFYIAEAIHGHGEEHEETVHEVPHEVEIGAAEAAA